MYIFKILEYFFSKGNYFRSNNSSLLKNLLEQYLCNSLKSILI